MEHTFISVARDAGNIKSLTPEERKQILHQFEQVADAHRKMFKKENQQDRFSIPLSVYYYTSLADNLEQRWGSSVLPTLQQEHKLLKLLWQS